MTPSRDVLVDSLPLQTADGPAYRRKKKTRSRKATQSNASTGWKKARCTKLTERETVECYVAECNSISLLFAPPVQTVHTGLQTTSTSTCRSVSSLFPGLNPMIEMIRIRADSIRLVLGSSTAWMRHSKRYKQMRECKPQLCGGLKLELVGIGWRNKRGPKKLTSVRTVAQSPDSRLARQSGLCLSPSKSTSELRCTVVT